MVRKSFKTCRILNALDGTEDNEVYPGDMVIEDEFETDSEEER